MRLFGIYDCSKIGFDFLIKGKIPEEKTEWWNLKEQVFQSRKKLVNSRLKGKHVLKKNHCGENQHCISDTYDLYACEQENVKGERAVFLSKWSMEVH